MEKKSIIIVYYEMILGGSTTSLLSLLNCIDKERYDVDLQLYKNSGELFDMIPDGINVLPEAALPINRINKTIKGLAKGYLFKAWMINRINKRRGFSRQLLSLFQSRELSRNNNKEYDYAISFIEGWPNFYLAESIKAKHKYGWYHSTFNENNWYPRYEKIWWNVADNIVFVSDSCTRDFCRLFPAFSSKAKTIENILDSLIVRHRSEKIDLHDQCYVRYHDFKGMRLVSVCRIDIQTKGLDRVVNCARALKEKGYDFLWYVVGDGADREALQALINEAKVDESLILIGKRSNPYPFIKDSDILGMPSRFEGKPMTVTEAMILGTVPVVTEYLSAHEQIKDGYDGVVCMNDESSFINSIISMIENTQKLQDMKKIIKQNEYGNEKYIRFIEKELLD